MKVDPEKVIDRLRKKYTQELVYFSVQRVLDKDKDADYTTQEATELCDVYASKLLALDEVESQFMIPHNEDKL